MTSPSPLKPITRLITTHNDEGKAIFERGIPDQPERRSVDGDTAVFALSYCTEEFPVDMNDDKDLKVYQKNVTEAPGLVIGSGTVLRHVDIAPGKTSPMHRTVSLDYGIVIEGEIELVLDSGETRRMMPGDVAVQRGTMHAWRNVSSTHWGRMLYVLTPSKPLNVAGERLGEDLETMKGVRAST